MEKVFPRIIMHMKARFQRNDNYPISLEEILDELQIFDLTNKATRLNLDTQVLPNNPKLETIMEDNVRKYTYKPYFKIRNRKDLINLIKDHQTKGLGGLLYDDVQESMTTEEFERIFKRPSEEIVQITGKGKKKILFYNEKNSQDNIQVEEDIIKYWRDVPVEGQDEEKIEEYLEKQGIASMKDAFANKKMTHQPTQKRKLPTKGRQVKTHNVHLGDILNEYNPDLIKK